MLFLADRLLAFSSCSLIAGTKSALTIIIATVTERGCINGTMIARYEESLSFASSRLEYGDTRGKVVAVLVHMSNSVAAEIDRCDHTSLFSVAYIFSFIVVKVRHGRDIRVRQVKKNSLM
jgi:hypothetical protein